MTELRCWRDEAACRDVVTAACDPFFADTKAEQLEAIAICASCSVRDDCLTFAVRTGQQYGIWGGQPQLTIRRLIALTAPAGSTPIGRPLVIRRPERPTASAGIALAETPTPPRTASAAAAPARDGRGLRGGGPDAA